MKQHRSWLIGSVAVLVLAMGAPTAFAQGGPPPGGFGGGPGGGFGGPGGPGGPGGFGQRNRVETLASAPIEALISGLKLTSTQAQKIKTIQSTVRPHPGGFGGPGGGPGGQRPQPGQGGPGQGGGRPDPAAMQAKEKTATKNIEAVLTGSQKQAVPGVLKDIKTLRSVNIPAELIGSLRLTAAQKTKLASIASTSQQKMQQKMQSAQESGNFQSMRQMMQSVRTDADKQVKAVLTSSQNAQVTKFKADNPQRGFGGPGGGPGGPGGFGGPPPGGFGGPGGPDGPPQF